MNSNQDQNLTETQVLIKTIINKTENLTKVKNSIQNITTPKITINKNEDNILTVHGDLTLLSNIKKRIKKNEMEEFAFNILKKNKTENTLKFYINKQAAFNNDFHMIDENMSQLGDIEVFITCNNPDEIIEWITQ